MIVNKTQLAQILGKSEEWLTQAQKDPSFPVMTRRRGAKGNEYESADVITYLQKKQVNSLLGDAGAIDIEEAKRRKIVAEAGIAETELAQAQGVLVEANQIEREWSELVANCRAKLLAIPAKVGPEIFAADSLVEVKVLLKKSINEALHELSVSSGDSEESSEGVSTAS